MNKTFNLVDIVVPQSEFDAVYNWNILNVTTVRLNGIPISTWGEYKYDDENYHIIDFEPESTGEDDIYIIHLVRPL